MFNQDCVSLCALFLACARMYTTLLVGTTKNVFDEIERRQLFVWR